MNVEWILSSGGLILLILLARFLFRKKLTPCLRYALWLLVAFRLLIPVFVWETDISILNLLPEAEKEREDGGWQSVYEENGQAADGLPEYAAAPGPGRETESAVGGIDIPAGESKKAVEKQEKSKAADGNTTGEESLSENGTKIKTKEALGAIWQLGAALFCGIFLTVNLSYGRRLKRSRKPMDPESLPVMSVIPVYETQMVQTPCLFGLSEPAVYIAEDRKEEEKTLLYVLCHENMHYRHRDNWWALVRILCLCLHWFNPLVWLAARLSRQDGEMACDEKALKLLGDKARVDYGRTLLELSQRESSHINEWRISTAMSGSGRQMKERLHMIVNAPVRTVGMRIFTLLLAAILTAVTFTGKSSAQGKTEPEAQKKEESLPEESIEEALKADEPAESGSLEDGENTLKVDLNFDGWEDLCYQVQNPLDSDMPYYCMLWNPESGQYEYSVTLYDVEVDDRDKWIAEKVADSGGQKKTVYYRYDENNQLHMVKYVEENTGADSVFERLELTYVEDEDSPYTLPAIVDGQGLHRTMISMARQSLEELYQWTGDRVDAACFQISNMGDVCFGLTPEDIMHSRIFYSRAFGADTVYNLSDYEASISSMYVFSGRSVWYSPVLWRVFPEQTDQMTDEEIVSWYLERTPLVRNCKVKSIEKRYEDMWTVQTQAGHWFEVVYDGRLREVSMVTGPYPDYPIH